MNLYMFVQIKSCNFDILHEMKIIEGIKNDNNHYNRWVCMVLQVVTAYDESPPGFESWVIYYKALITYRADPSLRSLRGSTCYQSMNFAKAILWHANWLICIEAVFENDNNSLASSGICHRNKVNSIAWLYRDGLANKIVLVTKSRICMFLRRLGKWWWGGCVECHWRMESSVVVSWIFTGLFK